MTRFADCRLSLSKFCTLAVALPTLGAALLFFNGCTESGSPSSARNASRELSDALSGDVLLQDVITTLNNLPNYVNLELRPPTVVLDSSKSRDGRTVMAVVTTDPQQPGSGAYDILYCTSRNSRFRLLEVQPGDRIRLFVLRDEYGKQDYIELVVQEVINETTLRIAGGLNQPVPAPERLEIWRYADERIMDIATRLRQYTERQPVVGWEPSPDEAALEQMIERLNQWARQRKPDGNWQLDPLVSTLPAELQKYIDQNDLATLTFRPYEARLLQESIWLRDISNWARGNALDDLGIAQNLFDWTVRNIQLTTREELNGRHHRPWQALMYGRGTADERAWIFTLLARQQGMPVVMLAYPDPENPEALKPWLPALLSKGELYLFDPQLGLPIPGPADQPVATLAAVRADDQLLRRLDLDAEHPYPVQAADLEHVVALVEASPLTLSKRAKLFEEELAGDQKVALTSEPSLLAESLKSTGQIAEVRLWELPYQTRNEQLTREKQVQYIAAGEFQVFAFRPVLWKARVLHFRGEFDGEESAKSHYRRARPAESTIADAPRHDEEKNLIRQGKVHASYWLGLLTFDTQEYNVAVDYFLNRTLKATPDGLWTQGARYNLARTYEAQGKLDEATRLYTANNSPQSHGNRLRARWLQEEQQPADDADGETSATETPQEPEASADTSEANPAEPVTE